MRAPDPIPTLPPKRRRRDAAIGFIAVVMVVAASFLLAGCNDRAESVNDSDSGLTQEAPRPAPGVQDDLSKAELTRLMSVTDGDTVVVRMPNGSRANVRLIGIDTPETYPQLECGGRAATAYLKTLVAPGDRLQLYTDKTQDTVDRFGRILRFVYTSNDLDVGLRQVSTGHARVYVYARNPFTLVNEYRAKERAAKKQNIGIWGACS